MAIFVEVVPLSLDFFPVGNRFVVFVKAPVIIFFLPTFFDFFNFFYFRLLLFCGGSFFLCFSSLSSILEELSVFSTFSFDFSWFSIFEVLE